MLLRDFNWWFDDCFQQSFKTAQVVPRNGHKILETMAGELETMFRMKIGAVEVSKMNKIYMCVCERASVYAYKRNNTNTLRTQPTHHSFSFMAPDWIINEFISTPLPVSLSLYLTQRLVDNAEMSAMSHKRKGDDCDPRIDYFDSKEMLEPDEFIPTTETPKLDDRSMPPINVTIRRVILQENHNFFNYRVNTTMSSVHVPTNVFARGNYDSVGTRFDRKTATHWHWTLCFVCSQLVLYSRTFNGPIN